MEKQESLPFPPTPMAGRASLSMQESVYQQRVTPRRLAPDAPNILIVLMDDAGPGQPSTFGGEMHADVGPHPRRGDRLQPFSHDGPVLAEPSVATDGAQSSQGVHRGDHRVRERLGCVLRAHPQEQRARGGSAEGLRLCHAGWGKWHNTPAIEAGPTGPFEYWPTNSGFEYFYGFLAGESSQFEPNLVRNTTFVLPSKTPDEGYHLNEDLADDAIGWLHKHKAMAPDRPFFMYWASGAIHGPPTMHPRSTSTSTGASSTTAGTPTGSAYSSGPRTRAGSHAKRN